MISRAAPNYRVEGPEAVKLWYLSSLQLLGLDAIFGCLRGIPLPDRSPRPASKAIVGGCGRTPSRGPNSTYLKSRVVKRSIVVGHHKTSVSLEDVFWNELRKIAFEQGVPISHLVGRIDAERQHGNLSSALRVFVFEQSCQRTARISRRT